MKFTFISLAIFSFVSLQLDAQNCIDTIHLKGYYVIMRSANEINPKVTRSGNTTTLEQPIDVHYDPSFILCDSITKKHPLSYWLNHFFDNTKQAFISCEKFGIKYFVTKECLPELKNKNDSCNFPTLKSKVLYQTTNLKAGDVFEIYYIDAYWAKIRIKKDSPEADIIPSKIAQRCINSRLTEFDLYYFIRYNKLNMSPQIKDAYIKVWKR